MKILIVSLASQYIHSALSLWYLYYSAKANCSKDITVKVLEGTVNENIDEIFGRIEKENPNIVAFSCYIWNIEYVKILAEKLNKKGIKILLGGPEVSYNTKEILTENNCVDYILSGEGEEPFVLFLNEVYKKGDLTKVPGLSFRKGEKLHLGEPFKTSAIPVNPYGEEYLKALNGRIAYIETSRGCPFSCAFCLSGRLSSVRFFPIDRAKQDILILANSESKIIKFVDRTFNANPKRAREIFKFIIENYGKAIPNGVCFHFEIAGDLLGDEDFKLLKKSPKGAIQFEIGIQSFNAKTLISVGRKTNVERLKNNIGNLCAMENIHIHIDLIAGLPFEDLTSFRESFNRAFSLNADMLQLGFLKLLHGAQMREQKEKYPCDFSKKPPYEVNFTPWISKENLISLHFTENALDRFVGSGRFPRTNKLIFEIQKRNPFDTLTELGMFTGCESCSLNEYVSKLYSFFGRDKGALRDALISDVATSVKSATLPNCLNVADRRLKELKKHLESDDNTRRPKGVMRNVFLLYGENCGAYVDYDRKSDGKFLLKKIKFETGE